jgi:hypothetical protein
MNDFIRLLKAIIFVFLYNFLKQKYNIEKNPMASTGEVLLVVDVLLVADELQELLVAGMLQALQEPSGP